MTNPHTPTNTPNDYTSFITIVTCTTRFLYFHLYVRWYNTVLPSVKIESEKIVFLEGHQQWKEQVECRGEEWGVEDAEFTKIDKTSQLYPHHHCFLSIYRTIQINIRR